MTTPRFIDVQNNRNKRCVHSRMAGRRSPPLIENGIKIVASVVLEPLAFGLSESFDNKSELNDHPYKQHRFFDSEDDSQQVDVVVRETPQIEQWAQCRSSFLNSRSAQAYQLLLESRT